MSSASDAVRHKLWELTKDRGCPMCGSLSERPALDDDTHTTAIISTNLEKMETYSFSCSNCGYVMQFSRHFLDRAVAIAPHKIGDNNG